MLYNPFSVWNITSIQLTWLEYVICICYVWLTVLFTIYMNVSFFVINMRDWRYKQTVNRCSIKPKLASYYVHISYLFNFFVTVSIHFQTSVNDMYDDIYVYKHTWNWTQNLIKQTLKLGHCFRRNILNYTY